MKIKIAIIVAFAVAAVGIAQNGLSAQSEAERSVLEGVYTGEQAGRGRELVIKIGCGSCHNSDLGGGIEETPSLTGNEFMATWTGQLLSDLDSQLTTMPADGVYKLSPQERVDVIAFLLGINGVPIGKTELPPDPALLRRTRIKFP